MQQALLAVVVAFLVCIALGPFAIKVLKRLKFGQNVRDDGPQEHLSKAGTPTMGGVLIVFALIVSTVIFTKGSLEYTLFALLITVGFGLIGFLDDIIKIIRKRSLGLKAYQKIIGQLGLALVVAFFAYNHHDIGSKIIVPFLNVEWDLGVWYIPFAVFAVLGFVNGVNLTDGLDGLAAGVTLIDSAAFVLIYVYAAYNAELSGAYLQSVNLQNMGVFAGALTGALLGFLRFNSHPAKVFMGDTGAFALGGAISALAVAYRLPLLTVIMGGAYVLSCISVILQVGSYKLRHGKRVFKMAPIHHHFELLGVPEHRIVAMYMIATVFLCLVAILAIS